MIDSHLVQTLRITFLSIGFVLFVVMAVHWVQHVSTTRPKLTPHVIAVTPLSVGATTPEASGNLHESSLASLVQPSASAASSSVQQPGHSSATPASSAAAAGQSSMVTKAPATPSRSAKSSAPSLPTPPHDVQNPTDLIQAKSPSATAHHVMQSPHNN